MTDAEVVEPAYKPVELWATRNYSVFGTLAGVRAEDGTAPISRPRGLPEDLSPEVRIWASYWEDKHSAGWLSVPEILRHRSFESRSRLGRLLLGPPSEDADWADFVAEVILPLVKNSRPEDLRVVFWFND